MPSKYFVLHLSSDDCCPIPGAKCSVQLLDSQGRERAAGYLGGAETELVVEDETIPAAVLDAARRQPCGVGDYVSERGERIPAF